MLGEEADQVVPPAVGGVHLPFLGRVQLEGDDRDKGRERVLEGDDVRRVHDHPAQVGRHRADDLKGSGGRRVDVSLQRPDQRRAVLAAGRGAAEAQRQRQPGQRNDLRPGGEKVSGVSEAEHARERESKSAPPESFKLQMRAQPMRAQWPHPGGHGDRFGPGLGGKAEGLQMVQPGGRPGSRPGPQEGADLFAPLLKAGADQGLGFRRKGPRGPRAAPGAGGRTRSPGADKSTRRRLVAGRRRIGGLEEDRDRPERFPPGSAT